MQRARTGLICLVPLLGALGGCGEDAEQVTAEELVSRGDQICREADERFDEIQSRPAPNAKEVAEQTQELVEAETDALDELRNLRPPDELREAYDAYLEAAGRALDLLEEGRDAAEQGDADRFLEAREEKSAGLAERARLAKAVGFQVCSRQTG